MSVEMKEKRFFLYLDILGFKEMINKYDQHPDIIYNILDISLGSASYWSESRERYNTLSFSDTILFWQKEARNDAKSFSELCSLSQLILSTILAYDIPVRGMILYDELYVKQDRSNKYNIFWGKGLIEAYEHEKRENWVGVTIGSSAANILNIDQIKEGVQKRKWIHRRETNELLLNPFQFCTNFWNKLEGEKYDSYMCAEIKALKFIQSSLSALSSKGDLSSRVYTKYLAASNFINSVMDQECYNWMLSRAAVFSEDESWDASTSKIYSK